MREKCARRKVYVKLKFKKFIKFEVKLSKSSNVWHLLNECLAKSMTRNRVQKLLKNCDTI